jgi:hypothetical protein
MDTGISGGRLKGMSEKKIQAAKETLIDSGYSVRKKQPATKSHTFMIEVGLLEELKLVVFRRRISLRAALSDAIRMWIENQEELKEQKK